MRLETVGREWVKLLGLKAGGALGVGVSETNWDIGSGYGVAGVEYK